ncbi:MAG: SPOR domain-containing protein [Candidatus Symbiothrix sp.]|jgi:cell division protein FtsN|nr:SPOR domain-containing protein [Candidatus Symbiothrix sp.]
MKSKIYLLALVFTLFFSFNACKPKQSAYKAAYDAAKAKEMQDTRQQSTFEEVTPATKPSIVEPADFQKEKVTLVEGHSIHLYNLVIGSFINLTNAKSLKERMEREGYKPVLAQNEKGMYRVIIASFDDRSLAVLKKEEIKGRFSPEFSDAWLLEQDKH